MHVAITVWGNRISPVFDSAQTLLIAEICQKKVVDRKLQLFQAALFSQCLRQLEQLNVRVLICGALCEAPVRLLESRSIEVIPFIAGETEEILRCYAEGQDLAEFAMPGCGHARCCRTRKGGVRERGVKAAGLIGGIEPKYTRLDWADGKRKQQRNKREGKLCQD